LTILVLSRDILILTVAAVILLVSGYRPFPPSFLGKLTTASQIIFVFTLVLAAAYPNERLTAINHMLVYAVTAITLLSGFHYSFSMARRLSSS
jgi:phosphatidylglycerophosphate synthase